MEECRECRRAGDTQRADQGVLGHIYMFLAVGQGAGDLQHSHDTPVVIAGSHTAYRSPWQGTTLLRFLGRYL